MIPCPSLIQDIRHPARFSRSSTTPCPVQSLLLKSHRHHHLVLVFLSITTSSPSPRLLILLLPPPPPSILTFSIHSNNTHPRHPQHRPQHQHRRPNLINPLPPPHQPPRTLPPLQPPRTLQVQRVRQRRRVGPLAGAREFLGADREGPVRRAQERPGPGDAGGGGEEGGQVEGLLEGAGGRGVG